MTQQEGIHPKQQWILHVGSTQNHFQRRKKIKICIVKTPKQESGDGTLNTWGRPPVELCSKEMVIWQGEFPAETEWGVKDMTRLPTPVESQTENHRAILPWHYHLCHSLCRPARHSVITSVTHCACLHVTQPSGIGKEKVGAVELLKEGEITRWIWTSVGSGNNSLEVIFLYQNQQRAARQGEAKNLFKSQGKTRKVLLVNGLQTN